LLRLLDWPLPAGTIALFATLKGSCRNSREPVLARGGHKMLYRLPARRSGRAQLLRRQAIWPLLYDLGGSFAQWLRFRKEIWRLSRLDDRLLADIGVERQDIAARVKGDR
jgi:uncharacterized protein YjiS (DUF1127 family)